MHLCVKIYIFLSLRGGYTFFLYKQPHFRVEPRVAIEYPKMRLKVAMKLLSIFGIVAKLFDNFRLKCMENKQKLAKLTKVAKNF